MIIIFADKKLKEYANNNKMAVKKMGDKRAKLYQKRLEDMADAGCFADLVHLPGRYHQLTGNRKEQWSCDLDHPYRLIFKPAEEPIPKNEHGKQRLTEINCLEVIEIINYHKEK